MITGHNRRNMPLSLPFVSFPVFLVECFQRQIKKKKKSTLSSTAYFELFLHFGQFPLQGPAFALLRFCHGVASVALLTCRRIKLNHEPKREFIGAFFFFFFFTTWKALSSWSLHLLRSSWVVRSRSRSRSFSTWLSSHNWETKSIKIIKKKIIIIIITII